jgi:caffeoyl-CoA O-methyltransferase
MTPGTRSAEPSSPRAGGPSGQAPGAHGKFTPLTEELHGFLVEHGAREDEVLRRLREETAAMGDVAVMQIPPEQGALLTLLARVAGAHRAIEVGTFTGYSAICIARGLGAGGKLITCELREDYAETARGYFAAAGVAERIELRVGPALETLRSLPGDPLVDLAFVDADKVGYPDYYEECLTRARPGGVIALDNLLLGGRVLDPGCDDESARTMRALAARLGADERVDVAMIGISDGVVLARKR